MPHCFMATRVTPDEAVSRLAVGRVSDVVCGSECVVGGAAVGNCGNVPLFCVER